MTKPSTMTRRIPIFAVIAAALGLLLPPATSFSVLPPTRRSSISIQQARAPQCMVDRPSVLTTPPPFWRLAATSSSSSSSLEDTLVDANDTEGLKNLFAKYADPDGLVSKEKLQLMPPFAQLLDEGDLLMEEWNDIWNAAADGESIGVEAFVQIYKDVDDLFENDDEDVSAEPVVAIQEDGNNLENDMEDDVGAELSAIYQSICGNDGLISKETLKQWEEVDKLLSEGLLGDDEFEELWDNAPKTEGDSLDKSGFLSFNVALDALFEFDDDEEEEEEQDDEAPEASVPRAMVSEGDNPPSVLFSQLANKDYLVGMEELKLWVELQEMISEGDLLVSELQDMYDKYAKDGKLTEETFQNLYDDIDALFEEDDDGDTPSDNAASPAAAPVPPPQQSAETVKKDLLAFLDLIDEEDEELLPCGLDATEKDQMQVLNIVNVLQQQPTNLVLKKQGLIDLADMAGSWELIYSSSSAMKFNKGLSGLGGSFPNGKFAGVRQEMTATKFLNDMEYKERIKVVPDTASFEVSVTGSWDLRTSVSLFTGQPSIVLNVEPERVNYGPTSTRADHWKSLGPLNMLDLAYLDEDLRVMRGCTSSDTLFIFKKV